MFQKEWFRAPSTSAANDRHPFLFRVLESDLRVQATHALLTHVLNGSSPDWLTKFTADNRDVGPTMSWTTEPRFRTRDKNMETCATTASRASPEVAYRSSRQGNERCCRKTRYVQYFETGTRDHNSKRSTKAFGEVSKVFFGTPLCAKLS